MAFDQAKMRSPTQGIKLILKDVMCNRVMAFDNAKDETCDSGHREEMLGG